MNKRVSYYSFLLLFILCFFKLNAQTKKTTAKQLLSKIETEFNVSFSYADQSLSGVEVFIDLNNKNLPSILEEIEQTTSLQFNKIDNTFYSVTQKDQQLNLSLQELEEVVINHYLTSGIKKHNSGSISITPSKFGILPGLTEADILQTIQALPGIVSVDETVSNINIRGGTHDQNLLLYEGIKMYQTGHFFGLISAFNSQLTQHVTVTKNGTSAKYGDGISSVVSMQLSDKIQEDNQFGAAINLVSASVFTKLPLSKNTEIQLAARRSITDMINTPTYNQYFERVFQDTDLTNTEDAATSKNENFYFYDTALKFLYDISSKDKLRFNFLNIYNDLEYNEEATINTNNEASVSHLSQQNIASGLSYHRQWSDKINTLTQLYYSNYNLDATNYDILNNQRLVQENNVLDAGLKFQLNYQLNSTINFDAGLQLSEVGISNLEDVNNPLFKSYIKRVIRTYSSYLESEIKSKDKSAFLKFGLRHNYIPKFKTHLIEPRLQLSKAFLKHFRAEILAEIKSQTTSQIIDLQKDFLGIEKRRWVLSNNTTIPILKSKQLSFGLTYNKNKLLLSAEAYIKKVNGITTRSQGFQNQYQFVNAIGNYQIHGFDVLINKQFKHVSTWLSYTNSTNRYFFKDLNNSSKFANNFDITHVIDFGSTITFDQLKVALGVNWHSGRPYTSINNNSTSNTIVYNTPNDSRNNSYLRSDLSATYHFLIGKSNAEVGASIWNIFNKSNILNTYYTTTDNNINKVEHQSLGLTPNVSFKVRF